MILVKYHPNINPLTSLCIQTGVILLKVLQTLQFKYTNIIDNK